MCPMSPFHSCLFTFLARPHHDCLTTYHRTFSIQSPPIHYCPITPVPSMNCPSFAHFLPCHFDPYLPDPDRSVPVQPSCLTTPLTIIPDLSLTAKSFPAVPLRSITNHSMTANPYQYGTVRFGPLLAIAAVLRLISPIHSTPHHGCLIAPHHASRIQSLPLLPYPVRPQQTPPIPFPFANFLPHHYIPHPSKPIFDCLTRTDLAVSHRNFPRLDCPTKPRQTKPLVT
jgi:hypothetical protein